MTAALGGLSVEASAAARNSVSAAAQIATGIGGPSGDALRGAANRAFVDGFGVAMQV